MLTVQCSPAEILNTNRISNSGEIMAIEGGDESVKGERLIQD